MHLKRLLSAAIFIPIFLLLIFKGSALHFFLFLSIFLIGGLYEFFTLLRHLDIYCFSSIGYLLGFLLSITIFINSNYCTLTISLIILIILSIGLFKHQYQSQAIYSISGTLLGIFYISLPLSLLVSIRNTHYGRWLIFFFFIFIWAGDTFAFYLGITFGRHKLWPAVSPNKSIEGFIGGLLGNFITVIIFKILVFPSLTHLDCIWIALSVGIIGQIGDLFESLLKRSAQVKDSGSIIPGHGGILDRMDSILFAVPVFYYYLYFFTALIK